MTTAKKIAEIDAKLEALQKERETMLDQRGADIAVLAANHGLLEIDDAVLNGAFAEISDAIVGNQAKLDSWRSKGKTFRKPRSKKTANRASTAQTSTADLAASS